MSWPVVKISSLESISIQCCITAHPATAVSVSLGRKVEQILPLDISSITARSLSFNLVVRGEWTTYYTFQLREGDDLSEVTIKFLDSVPTVTRGQEACRRVDTTDVVEFQASCPLG